MKKIILLGVAILYGAVLMAQSTSTSLQANQTGGAIVNQRGDIHEVNPAGSKSEIRAGKGMFHNMKDMKEGRHHRHHGRHHRHHKNKNQNKVRPHTAHTRMHK